MPVRWKRLFWQSIVWLAAEIILTSIGLDDLADYSEFHITSKYGVITQLVQTIPTA